MRMIRWSLLVALLSACLTHAPTEGADLASSIEYVHRLYGMEQVLATKLDSFIEAKKQELERLTNLSAYLKETNPPTNPGQIKAIEGFALLKRLSDAKDEINDFSNNTETELFQWFDEMGTNFPDGSDVREAGGGILRLQRTYAKNVSFFLNDDTRWEDMYYIGIHAYDQADWMSCVQWLELSLTGMIDGGATDDMLAKAYDHLAYAYYKVNRFSEAMEISRKLLELEPENFRIQDNIEFYETKLNKEEPPQPLQQRDKSAFAFDNLLKQPWEDVSRFRQLCRQEKVNITAPRQDESCRYLVRPNTFTEVKPIQVEQLLTGQQDVKIFRNIVTDEEIEHIIASGKKQLSRSLAYNGHKLVTTEYRTSTVAWLEKNHDETIARVHEKIRLATGLNIDTAESLQVSNYGIGGHYELHRDWGGREVDDRYATFMIYLSEVEQGGCTVFPRLGVSVPPKRGDAIYWRNLLPSGNGDELTLHAGCPVLQGWKWVANKWFHLRGQGDGDEICTAKDLKTIRELEG